MVLAGSMVAVLTAATATGALAQRTDLPQSPVVLELYTAQGCSACPPADQMLAALAPRDDVIALALHVDYWDYIGWTDAFADPENGERQKRYARRHGHNTIYTPQVVIDGTDILEGFRVMPIMDLIERHRSQPREIELTLTRDEAGMLQIDGVRHDPAAPILASRATGLVMGSMAMSTAETHSTDEPPLTVQLVRYAPSHSVEITAGENAGLTAEYVNIVTSWETVGTWDDAAPLELEVPIEGTDPVVVIVQQAGQGPILAAARLR